MEELKKSRDKLTNATLAKDVVCEDGELLMIQ